MIKWKNSPKEEKIYKQIDSEFKEKINLKQAIEKINAQELDGYAQKQLIRTSKKLLSIISHNKLITEIDFHDSDKILKSISEPDEGHKVRNVLKYALHAGMNLPLISKQPPREANINPADKPPIKLEYQAFDLSELNQFTSFGSLEKFPEFKRQLIDLIKNAPEGKFYAIKESGNSLSPKDISSRMLAVRKTFRRTGIKWHIEFSKLRSCFVLCHSQDYEKGKKGVTK